MRFYIWICLDEHQTIRVQEDDILNLLKKWVKVTCHSTDNESIMTIEVEINSVSELLSIGEVLEDDIVIHGVDQDVITTKSDMKELGLN